MTKITIAIFSLIAMASLLFAANEVYTIGATSAVTTIDNIVYYADSFTTHTDSGVTTISFPSPVYNINITSLNGAADSGYITVRVDDVVKVPPYTHAGSHHTTVPATYSTFTIGNNSEADTVKIYMGVRELTLTPTVGGAADSATTVRIWGQR